MKKLLCFVTAVLMVLMLMPTLALADNTIAAVYLTAPTSMPALGQPLSISGLASMNTAQYTVDMDNSYWVHTIPGYPAPHGCKDGEYPEVGCTYRLHVRLLAKEGYVFTGSTTATARMGDAAGTVDSIAADGKSMKVEFSLNDAPMEYSPENSIPAINFRLYYGSGNPVIPDPPVLQAGMSTREFLVSTNTCNAQLLSWKLVLKESGPYWEAGDDTFFAYTQAKYFIEIKAMADRGYEFASAPKVAVNGRDFSADARLSWANDDSLLTVYYPLEVIDPIREVNVPILTDPFLYDGMECPTGEVMTWRPDEYTAEYESWKVLNDNGRLGGVVQTLEAGKKYQVTVKFAAREGYVFALRNDLTVRLGTKTITNGASAEGSIVSYENGGYVEPGKSFTACCIVTCPTADDMLGPVKLSGITPPIPGVKLDASTVTADKAEVVEAEWIGLDDEGSFIHVDGTAADADAPLCPPNSGAYTPGAAYMLYVTLKLPEGKAWGALWENYATGCGLDFYPVFVDYVEGTVEVYRGVPFAEKDSRFPDVRFYGALLEQCDTNHDRFLSDGELCAVTALDVSRRQIADFTGIEYLPNLERLNAAGNAMESLVLYDNRKLTYVDCSGSPALSDLRVGGLFDLRYLNCSECSLRQLRIEDTGLLQTLADDSRLGRQSPTDYMDLYLTQAQNLNFVELDYAYNEKISRFPTEEALPEPRMRSVEALQDGLEITWDTVTGADGYNLYCMEGENGRWLLLQSSESNTCVHHAKPGTVYYYSAKAYGSDSTVGVRQSPLGRSKLCGQFMEAPAVTLANKADGVNITWSASEGAVRYEVLRKANVNWETLAETDRLSYTDTEATYGVTYAYAVRAVGTTGARSWRDSTGNRHTYLPLQPQPRMLSARAAEEGIEITWEVLTDVVDYSIYRSRNADGPWDGIAAVSEACYTDPNVEPGTCYYYTVQANFKNETRSAYGSDPLSFTYLSQPALPTAANAAKGIKLTWTAVPGAEKYILYRKTGSAFFEPYTESTTLTFTDTGVASGTQYSYALGAVAADGSLSSNDPEGTAITFLACPALPALTNTSSGVKASWKAVPGAEKYILYRKTGTGSWSRVKETTALTCTDTTAKAGTEYIYTLRAKASDGSLSTYKAAGASITCTAVIAQPAQPALPTVANTASGVKVAWKSVSGASKYILYRKTSGTSWKQVYAGTALTCTDTTAAGGTKYWYTVRAKAADGTYSAYDKTGKAITRLAQPAVPTVANAAKGVKVAWAKVAGAAKYILYRKEASSAASWKQVYAGTALTYTDTAVTSGTKYWYTVKVKAADGTYSSYNTSGKGIMFLARPALPTVAKVSAGVKVTWKKIPGAGKYYIYRKVGSGSWAKAGESTSLTWTDKSVVSGKTYYYSIRALNSSGTFMSSYNTTGTKIAYKK